MSIEWQLKQHLAAEKRVEACEDNIDRLEARLVYARQLATDEERISGSTDVHMLESVIADYDEALSEYRDAVAYYKSCKLDLLDLSQRVKDGKAAAVILRYYGLGESWVSIGEAIGKTDKTVKQLHDKAILELSRG